ncbi:MAG: hypothetical protein IPK55_11200 [Streptococcus sp.]|nr:hypothetical protein [Streptococcus sp.]
MLVDQKDLNFRKCLEAFINESVVFANIKKTQPFWINKNLPKYKYDYVFLNYNWQSSSLQAMLEEESKNIDVKSFKDKHFEILQGLNHFLDSSLWHSFFSMQRFDFLGESEFPLF